MRLPDHVDGPRLALRRWTVDDVDRQAAAVAANIEHLRPWMAWIADEPLSHDARRALIEGWTSAWEAGGDALIAMFAGDEVVGSTGLHRRLGPSALEIGSWVHVDHVGRGYATEAAGLLTTLAFTVDGIERVEIHHDVHNHASEAVPRRLGYTRVDDIPYEITAPAECGTRGRWVMARSDWSPPPSCEPTGAPPAL
jgi:RimJ/RimL family protein N-acetyltransferase